MQSDIFLKPVISSAHTSADAKYCQWSENSRVLLVEDNYVNQVVVQGALASMGLATDVAINGQEAIDHLCASADELPYTLILMDCKMPVLDGYEACARIRAGGAGSKYKDLPIVAMTASVSQFEQDKCRDVGMNDFVGKPIDRVSLKRLLLKWLGSDTSEKNMAPSSSGNKTVTTLFWNEPELLARLGGKTERLNQSINAFMSDIKIQLNDLSVFIDNDELVSAAASVHTIKGLAGNLSAYRLFNASHVLENSIECRNIEKINADFLILKNGVHELEQYFHEYKAAR